MRPRTGADGRAGEFASISRGVELRRVERLAQIDADERAHEQSGDRVVALVSMDSVSRDAFAGLSGARREALASKGVREGSPAVDLAFVRRDPTGSSVTEEEFQRAQREQLGVWKDEHGVWWCIPCR